MPDVGSESEPLVAVAMATFEPEPELLERQLASLREQTHANWVCVISDDASSPERLCRRSSARPEATRASPSRAASNGSASTATSSAPSAWSRPRPSSSRSRTRTTAGTRTSSRPSRGRSAAPSSPTATRAPFAPTGPSSPRRFGASAATTSRTSLRCCSPTRSPAPRRCSGATCSTASSPSPMRRGRPTTTTGPPSSRSRAAASPTSTARCSTTSSIPARCSATRRSRPARRSAGAERLRRLGRDPSAARERWREAYEDEWRRIVALARALEERCELSAADRRVLGLVLAGRALAADVGVAGGAAAASARGPQRDEGIRAPPAAGAAVAPLRAAARRLPLAALDEAHHDQLVIAHHRVEPDVLTRATGSRRKRSRMRSMTICSSSSGPAPA